MSRPSKQAVLGEVLTPLLGSPVAGRFQAALTKQPWADPAYTEFLCTTPASLKLICAEVQGLGGALTAQLLRVHREHRKALCFEGDAGDESREQVLVTSMVPFANFLNSLPDSSQFLVDSARAAGLDIVRTFDHIDKNKDKKLSPNEWEEGLRTIVKESNTWLIPYVQYVSDHAPPTMPEDERLWIYEALKYLRQNFVLHIYPKISDLCEGPEGKAFARRMFEQADANKDGVIDFSEFACNVMLMLFQLVDTKVLRPAVAELKKQITKGPKGKGKARMDPMHQLSLRVAEVQPSSENLRAASLDEVKNPSAASPVSLRHIFPPNAGPGAVPLRTPFPSPAKANGDKGNSKGGKGKGKKRIWTPKDITIGPHGGPMVDGVEYEKPPPHRPPHAMPWESSTGWDGVCRSIPYAALKPLQQYAGRAYSADGAPHPLLADAKVAVPGGPGDWSQEPTARYGDKPPPAHQGGSFIIPGGGPESTEPGAGAEPEEPGTEGLAGLPGPGAEASEALRDGWLKQARGEHASVASFANHTIELMKHKAPAGLLQDALAAGQDEVRHAQACFLLASRFDPEGKQYEPGSFPAAKHAQVAETLEELAAKVASEGCMGETMGSLLAARQLRTATDRQVSEILRTIIHEEARHGVLAWRTVLWAVGVGGEPVLEAAKKVLEREMAKHALGASILEIPTQEKMAEAAALERFGIISPEAAQQLMGKQGVALVSALLAHLLKHCGGQAVGSFDPMAIMSVHIDAVSRGD